MAILGAAGDVFADLIRLFRVPHIYQAISLDIAYPAVVIAQKYIPYRTD